MEKQEEAGPPQRPRKGWQRVTPKQSQLRQTRETFRRDSPSPCQEVLAKHDAELEENPDTDSEIVCF